MNVRKLEINFTFSSKKADQSRRDVDNVRSPERNFEMTVHYPKKDTAFEIIKRMAHSILTWILETSSK